MPHARRAYRREGEEQRRKALIDATINIVEAKGVAAATVRAIADRAGVAPGLIRHYFEHKEDLIRTAFFTLMQRLLESGETGALPPGADPVERIVASIRHYLSPPVASMDAVVAWSGFVPAIRDDAAMQAVHFSTAATLYAQWEHLIRALPQIRTPVQIRHLAIACNAVLDGLWLETSLQPDTFPTDLALTIGLDAIATLLGIEIKAPEDVGDQG